MTSLGHPQDVSEEHPQDVGKTHSLELNIRPYGDIHIMSAGNVGRGRSMVLYIRQYVDVLRTLHWDVPRMSYFNVLRTLVEEVLRTSVGNVPWRYIEDHVEMSVGRRLETSSGRPRDVIVQGGWYWKTLLLDINKVQVDKSVYAEYLSDCSSKL